MYQAPSPGHFQIKAYGVAALLLVRPAHRPGPGFGLFIHMGIPFYKYVLNTGE
jgi:hypothetical protein